MPVLCMSMRFFTGIVHAFETPGRRSALSIWQMSSSGDRRSGVRRRQIGLTRFGQRSYQVVTVLHCSLGLSRMTVSIMESGAGSVEVSARPALPNTPFTSGKLFNTPSCACKSRRASEIEMPGSVVGM